MPARGTRTYSTCPAPGSSRIAAGACSRPENTLAAFDRAAALGADALEIDVRRTADGVVVVFHDDDTARLTGDAGHDRGADASTRCPRLDAASRLHAGRRTHLPVARAGGCDPGAHRGARALPGAAAQRGREARRRRRSRRRSPARSSTRPAPRRASASGRSSTRRQSGSGPLLPGVRALPPRAGAATCHVMAAKTGGAGAGCPGATTSPTCRTGWAT